MSDLLKDFKIPQGVIFEKEESLPNYGRFTAQPFERGFATTIGNSLRRVLLSSIPGCAIVAVKIDGVLHEFTTIPGVLEDVSELLLNLKKVRIKLADGIDKKVIHIEKKGPGELLASDLNVDPLVEIVNKDLHIASLNKDAKIKMDLQIERGRGYQPDEIFKQRIEQVGVITLDAIFSPIVKVNYKIENVRVGERVDFEKLIFEVWTDGTITPEDAIIKGVKILTEHLNSFLKFVSPEQVEVKKDEKELEKGEKELLKKILDISIDQLELTVRSHNCLEKVGLLKVGDIIKKTDAELMEIPNFGRKSLEEIKEKLSQYGLKLGMTDEEIKNLKIKDNIKI